MKILTLVYNGIHTLADLLVLDPGNPSVAARIREAGRSKPSLLARFVFAFNCVHGIYGEAVMFVK